MASEDNSSETTPSSETCDETRPPRPRPIVDPELAPPPAQSPGKRAIVFAIVVLALTGGFFAFAKIETPFDKQPPKWRAGQVVDLEISLIKEDSVNLACAASTIVEGRHCEYKTKTEKHAQVPDEKLLRNYTTTDGVNVLAAGLWSQPALAPAKLPAVRFAVKCKFKVEGTINKPLVRWDAAAAWAERDADLHVGLVSDCKVIPP